MSPDASWTIEPGVLTAVALAGFLYVRRWRQVRVQVDASAASRWRLTWFVSGLACVLIALESPVDSLADQLLVMHMAQHLLLLDVAPVLMTLGLTKVLLRPLTRHLQPVENTAGALASPWFAVVLYVGSMWVWHVPAVYDAAVQHSGVHALEHVTFTVAGLLYWWHLLSPIRSRKRLSGMGPVTYMLVTKLLVGLLGIALAFAPASLYAFYAHQPEYWGMTPRTDQAVAGLLMALEQSLVMGVALAWLFARMLGESDREDQRAERYA